MRIICLFILLLISIIVFIIVRTALHQHRGDSEKEYLLSGVSIISPKSVRFDETLNQYHEF